MVLSSPELGEEDDSSSSTSVSVDRGRNTHSTLEEVLSLSRLDFLKHHLKRSLDPSVADRISGALRESTRSH